MMVVVICSLIGILTGGLVHMAGAGSHSANLPASVNFSASLGLSLLGAGFAILLGRLTIGTLYSIPLELWLCPLFVIGGASLLKRMTR